MPEVVVLGKELARPLNKRCRIRVELPEFAIRAIHWRVEAVNSGDDAGEQVTLNGVIEWLLVTGSHDEANAADRRGHSRFHRCYVVWVMDATYQPEDD